MKHTIGAVGFGQKCPKTENSADYKVSPTCGAARVQLLMRARDGIRLPDGLFLIAQVDGGAWTRITRDDVNWEGMRS